MSSRTSTPSRKRTHRNKPVVSKEYEVSCPIDYKITDLPGSVFCSSLLDKYVSHVEVGPMKASILSNGNADVYMNGVSVPCTEFNLSYTRDGTTSVHLTFEMYNGKLVRQGD